MKRWGNLGLAVLGVSVSWVAYVGTQMTMLLTRPEWSPSAFRGYYQGDQLSYLSIVVNGANGDYSGEPFTQTGSNHYPRLWYQALGLVARILHVSPVTAWQLGGWAAQLFLVTAVSLTALLVARRWWATLFGFVPLVVGTFSWALSDTWQTTMDSHATLWGPFATLFTVNGEAAAMCLGGVAVLALIAGASRGLGTCGWLVLGTTVGLAVGLLANVQTYSFLSVTYLVCYGLAGHTILTRVRWPAVAATALALVALYVGGPRVGPDLGALATLLLGLLPAVPGLVVLVVRTRGRALVPALAAAVAASPQVVGTSVALADGDPFLNFRVVSSGGLGVTPHLGLLCAAAVAVPLVLVAAVGIVRHNTLWIAAPVAVALAWAVLASNDAWGANQEPYRFWIDMFFLAAVCAVPLSLGAITTVWRSPEGRRPANTVAVRGLAIGAVLVVVASGQDWRLFWKYTHEIPLISFTSPENAAYTRVARHIDDDRLLLAGPCIDPRLLKPTTSRPIAFYNRGLAWPAEKPAIEDALAGTEDGVLVDDTVLRAAGVGWLVTVTGCATDWRALYRERLRPVARSRFPVTAGNPERATVTLWRVDSN